MAEVKVTISPDLLALPDRLSRALDVAHEASGRAVLNELRTGIIAKGRIASFSGLRSIEKQFEDRGAIKAWLVGSQLSYAPFAFEYGRKPGKRPPIDAIVRWLAIKPVDLGGQDIRRVAFLIARSIGRKGVKAPHIFSQTTDKMRPEVEQIFERELQKVLR